MSMASNRNAIVTGVAGFIGSHLAEQLVSDGYDVVGIDAFTDYYPRVAKEANLADLYHSPHFRLLEGDVLDIDWVPLLGDTQYLFHAAAQPGVRGSWGESFGVYVRNNILATQKLLETAQAIGSLKAFIFASSSSVYGDAESLPTFEHAELKPVSPYGVTKAACEHLCRAYHKSFGLPVVTLRYFTAFGPRQRPDMAFHRFIGAILHEQEIVIYGDGEQTRDFTFVKDAVRATVAAATNGPPGQIFNVGGGCRISVNETIRILEDIMGTRARVRHLPAQKGDARHTSADISKAAEALGYRPMVGIEKGLRQEVAWLKASLK